MEPIINQKYTLIGLMSGTSLDGLDLACVEFTEGAASWSYKLLAAETRPYSDAWLKHLQDLPEASALVYAQAHADLGTLYGTETNKFIARHHLKPVAVASHGHTLFHNPARELTAQIGSGASMAVACGLPVICDFRTTDVALGGQGAPLVPIGDALLFSEYDVCLNLGGIANLSLKKNGSLTAFDVCPANMVLNSLVAPLGFAHDHNGNLARQGHINQGLLDTLNSSGYFRSQAPKTLGREWVEQQVLPVLDDSLLAVSVKLNTYCVHIAQQIARALQNQPAGTLLVTGGGAFNGYLLGSIKNALGSSWKVTTGNSDLIAFKEAVVFAFLGLLRLLEQNNTLATVTGARRDSCGGCIYLP